MRTGPHIGRDALTPFEIGARRTDEWELARMVRTLEANGYVVRRPSEADIESVLEVAPPERPFCYEIGVRLDTKFNGVPFALLKYFPIEHLLHPDDGEFREKVLPQIMSREIAHHLAERMIPCIADQVEKKIKPLVPEKRMSLDEIVSFIAGALRTTKHRVDPRHYGEKDQRKPPA